MLQSFHEYLETAYTFKPYNKDVNIHLFTFLKEGKNRGKGWLRNIIAYKEVNKKSFLSIKEHCLLFSVGSLFSGYSESNGKFLELGTVLICINK